MMATIRFYQARDAQQVGRLIAETYARFNLGFVPPDQLAAFLGPFQHAGSTDPDHQAAIAALIRADMVYVAQADGVIVGVLRGRKERLGSLFVHQDYHRQGIGRALVARFEQDSLALGVKLIRVAATQFGLPFYTALGYKKSTGLRLGWSFDGHGIPIQPMRKVLAK